MLEADPARLGPVLLAHLQAKQGDMSSFANDLIACWSLRDWRSCEQFAWQADLPASTRRNMLILLFQEAAQRFPDEVLSRLRELIKTHRLSKDSLNADGGGQAGPNPSYSCESITAGLAKGWTRQDDVAALSKIPTLPLKWQPLAYEVFSTEFTTTKAGLAMLDFIVAWDSRQPPTKEEKYCGLKWANWLAAQPVIRRLAGIAPLSAKAWLEANPERLHEGRELYDGVRNVYTAWWMQDAQAADAWYWQHRPKDALSTIINYALYKGDLDYATTLLKQHRDHPEYQMALASYAFHWREINPQEASRYVLQMKGQQRLESAADLAHSWRRLDAKAASDFLDQAVPPDMPERLEVDKEIKRLDSYAWDTRK